MRCTSAAADAAAQRRSAIPLARSPARAHQASRAPAFRRCRRRSIRASVAVGPDGTVYFCNYSASALNWSLLRRISTTGFIATVAGSALADGFNGDNILAVNAHLSCGDLTVGADFSIYVVDLVNRRVRRISQAGIITTIAGNGTNLLGAEGVDATQTSVVPGRIARRPRRQPLHRREHGQRHRRTGRIANTTRVHPME